MATLTVWRFDDPGGAERTAEMLREAQAQELITVEDAAWVSWEQGKKKPKTHQARSTTTAGALFGSFWGLLFGLLFFVPLLGLAVGAGMGALSGSLADVGIDDGFIREVREKVVPGTSALFVLSHGAVVDRIAEKFTGTDAELIQTNLSEDEEAKLREVFAHA
ncbi:DUF1269 domain-containing protein [Phytoactinopolyspora endophytica]|uniref:DUF1269 domain-containing protein n=1 Tax=Phytoactinopolyspora endophytica TaxID=1642495 RepID=UPI00101C0E11|nr:DUF1269 domain-containing protein [Phytoactinopolyspora endophytica]